MASGKKLLTEMIREFGVLSQAKKIWREHPLLESMTVKLADYVGIHAKSPKGEPLLGAAIAQAVMSYVQHSADSSDNDRAFNAYADQIIQHAVLVYSQNVFVETSNGEVKWMPFECSLEDFVARHPEANVTVSYRDPMFAKPLAVAFAMAKLVPYPLLESASSSAVFSELAA